MAGALACPQKGKTMSYSFQIKKKDGELTIVPMHESALPHIPDGTWTINGHIDAGVEGSRSIMVGYTSGDGQYQTASSGDIRRAIVEEMI